MAIRSAWREESRRYPTPLSILLCTVLIAAWSDFASSAGETSPPAVTADNLLRETIDGIGQRSDCESCELPPPNRTPVALAPRRGVFLRYRRIRHAEAAWAARCCHCARRFTKNCPGRDSLRGIREGGRRTRNLSGSCLRRAGALSCRLMAPRLGQHC